MKSKILRGKLFRYLFYILPGIVLYYLLPYLEAIEGETMLMITTRLCVVYIQGNQAPSIYELKPLPASRGA